MEKPWKFPMKYFLEFLAFPSIKEPMTQEISITFPSKFHDFLEGLSGKVFKKIRGKAMEKSTGNFIALGLLFQMEKPGNFK
jgi:hypothetical protein